MGVWGRGIERHTQGTDAAAAVSLSCITFGGGIGHAEPGYGCKAPNIAAPPTVAVSRKRSFGPRVGSTAAEAFPRSRMPRHTSATRKERTFSNSAASRNPHFDPSMSWSFAATVE